MSQPLDYIFIDTSTFRRCGFFNEAKEVKKLFDLAEKGQIGIIMPAVTEHEWRKHFFDNARFNFNDIKKKIGALGILDAMTFLDKISGLPAEYDQLIKTSFQTHMDRAKLIRLNVDYPSDQLVKIFDKYFAQEKPFGPGGKNKEFPDAFVLASLEKYAKENKLNHIVVLANDKDMTQYASDVLVQENEMNYLNQLILTRIPKFTQRQKEKANHDTSCIRAYIDSQPIAFVSKIRTKLEDFLNDPEIYMERLDYTDIEGINIENLECQIDSTQLEFTAIDDDSIEASVPVRVNAYVKVTHFDQENSIWDSEDKEYLIKQDTATKFELSSDCSLSIKYFRPEELDGVEIVDDDAVEIVSLDCSALQEAINERDPWYSSLKKDSYPDWEIMIEEHNKSDKRNKPYYPFEYTMNPPSPLQTSEIFEMLQKLRDDLDRLKGKIKGKE